MISTTPVPKVPLAVEEELEIVAAQKGFEFVSAALTCRDQTI
jgi:hypothetical protein